MAPADELEPTLARVGDPEADDLDAEVHDFKPLSAPPKPPLAAAVAAAFVTVLLFPVFIGAIVYSGAKQLTVSSPRASEYEGGALATEATLSFEDDGGVPKLLTTPLPGLDADGACKVVVDEAAEAGADTDGTQGISTRRVLQPIATSDEPSGGPAGAANVPVVMQAATRPLDARWRAAITTAQTLVRAMTHAEKVSLVRGFGWTNYKAAPGAYVGQTPPLPRLGIPSLNMQDGPQGFRTIDARLVGTVTAWPSQLALGATWDAELAREYGAALGREFRARGANVALGPGVNVLRVARNGRAPEYLTGEEPLLGGALGAAYVLGLQSEGVAAVVKHFVANSQEFLRESVDAIISERALHEVYYVPFEACVRAGAASIMCSYNKVNGVHTCGNSRVLQQLKENLRFTGWVMSDWWAVTDANALPFVDQEMPGTGTYGRPAHYGDAALAAAARRTTTVGEHQNVSVLDDMASRIIGGMLRADAFREPVCSAGCNCARSLYSPRRPPAAHAALSRRLAAASFVLLKNGASARGGAPTLPLLPPADVGGGGTAGGGSRAKLRVALVGSACSVARHIAADGDWKAGSYYVVGGSGRVIPPDDEVTTVRQALEAVPWIELAVSATDGVHAALNAAASADVVVACSGSTSSEAQDRPTLKLDHDDFLRDFSYRLKDASPLEASSTDTATEETAHTPPPLVVLAMAPGAFLTSEWGARADALGALFLAGAQSGRAIADVLTGQTSPSGRLPLSLPLEEAQLVAPCDASPCVHAEGLHVGWRALVNESVAYAFGHGLSYTTFAYAFAPRRAPPATLRAPSVAADDEAGVLLKFDVNVTNVGAVAGRDVVQLYLAYPDAADEPPLVLKGFERTALLGAGEAATVSFALTHRDLAIYDEVAAGWRLVPGMYKLLVGASSRDVRLDALIDVSLSE